MKALGLVLTGASFVLFFAAALAVFFFLNGGVDAIDDGEPGALMAYVPVAMALGLCGTLCFLAGSGLRGKFKQ